MTEARAPMVRVVVINWNGGDFVLRCLDHLVATDYPSDRLELLVLDNASEDGSDREILDRFPQVRLVPTGGNLGFVANNLGMRDLERDGIDFVALVNNDAFVEPGWLWPLVRELEAHPDVGAVNARMVFAPKFVEVRVESPTFQPPGDGRHLGVCLHEVTSNGTSVFPYTQFPKGAWGAERDERGLPFRWLGEDAILRVPVAMPDREELAPSTGFGFIELELRAEREKEVVVSCSSYRAHVQVGPEYRMVRIQHWNDSFDVINNAGSVFLEDGFGADRGYLQFDDGSYDEPVDVFNVCGGSVLFRRQFLEHVGLFDERFFLYYEDTDLSYRGQALGWRYRYVPESRMRHLHAASSGEGSDTFQFFVERNRLLLLTKNAPADLALRNVVGFVTATLSYARRDVLPPLLHRRRPPLRHLRNRARSFGSYLKLAPAMLRSRRELRRRASVSDAELRSRWITRAEWTAAEQRVVASAGSTLPAPPPTGEQAA